MTPPRRLEQRDPVVDEFSRLAEHYDRRWSFYVGATTRETMARLSIRPSDRVLDVGCGTGALLHALAREHPQAELAGVDPVPGMLAVARRKMPAGVELKEGWAEELPWPDARFDVVVSCNMFHYVRQPLTALREMARVLRPRGQLVITDWCDDYLVCRVCDWCLRLLDPAHFRMYGERDCARLLEQGGHLDVTIERYKISWMWGLMTATARKHAAG